MPKTNTTAMAMPLPPIKFTTLETAYLVFLNAKIINSQAEFSTRILGMKPSYYSCMKARGRIPTRGVLERLLNHTKQLLASFEDNPHLGKSHAFHLNQAHQRLTKLAGRIEEELLLRWALSL